MKRALILIISLTVFTFGSGWLLDSMQQRTAIRYLNSLHHIRQLVLADDLEAAASEQAYLHACWQKDAHWMNGLLDHHHTRDVEASLRHVATALDERSRLHSLFALDEVIDALEEVAQRDMAIIENIL